MELRFHARMRILTPPRTDDGMERLLLIPKAQRDNEGV
jgi:hypothetical protein